MNAPTDIPRASLASTTQSEGRHRWNRQKHGLIIALLILLILIVPPFWITYREYRQARLDHALLEAIKTEDDKKVLETLAEGASGEARDTGEPPTFREELLHLLDHFRHSETPSATDNPRLPALMLYLQFPIGRGRLCAHCSTMERRSTIGMNMEGRR